MKRNFLGDIEDNITDFIFTCGTVFFSDLNASVLRITHSTYMPELFH